MSRHPYAPTRPLNEEAGRPHDNKKVHAMRPLAPDEVGATALHQWPTFWAIGRKSTRRSQKRANAVAALVLAVALAGCGGAAGSAAKGSGSAAPSSSQPAVSTDGPPADLQFNATTVDGRPFNGATLKGQPILLWFWAPWCPICEGQISEVRDLVQKYQGRLTIVGVGGLDTAAHIRKAREVLPGTTQLVDTDGHVWRHFSVTQQATYVVIEDGKMVFDSTKLGWPIDYEVAGLLR